jgi:ferredoxin
VTAPTRVRIDPGKCQGHNRCYALVPDVFDVDELGQGLVKNDGIVPPALDARVRLAAANCPEFAITIDAPAPRDRAPR